jgi:hypothetical protein
MIFDVSRPGEPHASVSVTPREWGFGVKDRVVFRDGVEVGQLLGRARYRCIGVTLDTTRGANDKHLPAEWTAIAASARAPGMARRPISVYMAENSTDEVLRAIAAGAP